MQASMKEATSKQQPLHAIWEKSGSNVGLEGLQRANFSSNPEYGTRMFIQNVSGLTVDYMVLHPKDSTPHKIHCGKLKSRIYQMPSQ
jgi:hypothetical protein